MSEQRKAPDPTDHGRSRWRENLRWWIKIVLQPILFLAAGVLLLVFVVFLMTEAATIL